MRNVRWIFCRQMGQRGALDSKSWSAQVPHRQRWPQSTRAYAAPASQQITHSVQWPCSFLLRCTSSLLPDDDPLQAMILRNGPSIIPMYDPIGTIKLLDTTVAILNMSSIMPVSKTSRALEDLEEQTTS